MNTNKSVFRIAAAQTSAYAGDIAANVSRHLEFVRLAAERGAKVVVFPELSLTGYEPELASDLTLESEAEELISLQALSLEQNVTIVAGCPVRSNKAKPYIGAFVFRPRKPIETYRKRFVHSSEESHFIPSDDSVVLESHGKEIGIAICADIRHPLHSADAKAQGADIYAAGVAIIPDDIERSEAEMSKCSKKHRFLAVMANYASPTGGFAMSGRSAIWDESGTLVARAESTGERLVIAECLSTGWSGKVIGL